MNKSTYQMITDRFISLLEQGTVPWRQPWSEKGNLFDQQNLVTQHAYRGINSLMTLSQGYESPYWITFNQAKDLGANIRKGEKGTPIVYWVRLSKESERDSEDIRSFMMPKTYVVFNVAQVENLKLSERLLKRKEKELEFNPIEACESIVSNYESKPLIEHREQRAYFRPSTDTVNMPRPETFRSVEDYYAVLFHELTHSTGHVSRLKRDALTNKVASFGSHEYSKEELIAELGSAFLCAKAGIDSPHLEEQSAAYLKSWLKVLKNDSKLLIQASSAAQKSCDLILNVKQDEKEGEE